jgi:1-phosphofructokinase family hexose kinase
MRSINLIALTPSIDERIVLDRFEVGQACDAAAADAFAAGKAVNAAAALSTLMTMHEAAAAVRLFGIVGHGDLPLFEAFHAPPVVGSWVPDPAPTRRNLTLVDGAGGLICHVRRGTLPVSPRAFESMLTLLDGAAQPGDLCIVAGRLPNGLSAAHLHELLALLRRRGCRIVVDLRPESLADLDLTGVLLAKPNLEELSGLFGTALSSREQILHHARLLAARGPAYVVVSLGAHGALLVARDQQGCWHGKPMRAPEPVDPVGCGDAMVAGLTFALARDEPPARALRYGMACGYGNLFAAGPGRISVPHVADALARLQVAYEADI